jgi:hypothetical protein
MNSSALYGSFGVIPMDYISSKRRANERQVGVDGPQMMVGAPMQGDVTTSTARNAAQARLLLFSVVCIPDP